MLTWVAKQSHDRPWLRIVVGAYLSLFTLELVRVSVFARPTIYDAGFYEWEEVSPSDRQAPSRFRWTAEQGLMLRPSRVLCSMSRCWSGILTLPRGVFRYG